MSLKKFLVSGTATLSFAVVLTALIFVTAAWTFSNTLVINGQNVEYQDSISIQTASGTTNTWSEISEKLVGTAYYQNVTATLVDMSTSGYNYMLSVNISDSNGLSSLTNDIQIWYLFDGNFVQLTLTRQIMPDSSCYLNGTTSPLFISSSSSVPAPSQTWEFMIIAGTPGTYGFSFVAIQ